MGNEPSYRRPDIHLTPPEILYPDDDFYKFSASPFSYSFNARRCAHLFGDFLVDKESEFAVRPRPSRRVRRARHRRRARLACVVCR